MIHVVGPSVDVAHRYVVSSPYGGGGAAAWTPADWGADRLGDYTADDVLTSGSAVTAFVDQSLAGINVSQGVAANQGVLVASHAALNNKVGR